jgi:hypothetical protein
LSDDTRCHLQTRVSTFKLCANSHYPLVVRVSILVVSSHASSPSRTFINNSHLPSQAGRVHYSESLSLRTVPIPSRYTVQLRWLPSRGKVTDASCLLFREKSRYIMEFFLNGRRKAAKFVLFKSLIDPTNQGSLF